MAAAATFRVWGDTVCSRSQVSKVWLSHSSALSAVHGASTGTCVDISSTSAMTATRSGRIVGSGGAPPVGPQLGYGRTTPSRL